MTKKIVKVIAILLMSVLMFSLVGSTIVNAEEVSDPFNTSAFDTIRDTTGAASSVTRIIGTLINVIQIVGTGVAIIMLIVLAIKYISAAPSDKAEIKKHAVVYVVGAVVLFAATGILEIVKRFAKNVRADA